MGVSFQYKEMRVH